MRRRISLLAGLCLAATVRAAVADPAGLSLDRGADAAGTAVSGNCTNLVNTNIETDSSLGASTTSGSFVNVPNTAISFTQGGAGAGCVIATFTAESWAAASRLLLVRAKLDGSIVAQPGVIQFSGDDDENNNGRWARSHSTMFFFPAVAPGAHTMVIQYASANGGARVFIYKHTTAIQHP